MPASGPAPDAQQLSLFDVAPAPQPPSAVRHTPVAATPPAAPPRPVSTLAPAVFRHPRAEREVRLDGHVVGYEFRRARRRSIGFVVAPEGLTVSAPRWVGVHEVEQALQEKSRWILRKLREQQERGERLAASRIDWRDGASVPFLGDAVVLVLDPRVAGAQLQVCDDSERALPGVAQHMLRVGLPQSASAEQIRDVVQSWLQRQAKRVFEERCDLYAQRLGVRVTRLSLSSATTRWGSASADGSIRLHWRLVHFAMPVIDYVVAHELAHLREMNHGPAFWDVVRSVIPDVDSVRGRLRHEVLPAFD